MQKATSTAKSLGGFITDGESWKGMGRNSVNLVKSAYDSSVGKVYDAGLVLANEVNADGNKSLGAVADVATDRFIQYSYCSSRSGIRRLESWWLCTNYR
ncbi:MAG: hypothetical protein ABL930_11440 [Pseudobdellovibrio sp.]